MWILPTYNRPHLLRDTLKLFAFAETKGLILVNGCDTPEYRESVRYKPDGWKVESLPENLGVAGAMQYAFEKYPNEPWYGWLADDLIPKTEGWDTKLVEALNDKTLIASASNNWHKPNRFQTGIVSGDLAREVGFLHLPGTWGCYSDDFWERLGTELGIWKSFDDVVVETLNPRKGDYEWDAASEATYNETTFAKDGQIWEAFQEGPYQALRERIREKFSVGAPREVKFNGVHVLICTPSIDSKFDSAYLMSLAASIKMLDRLKIKWDVQVIDKCSILPHARNRLVGEFLASEATHMLFIDDDMGWPQNAIPELLAHDKDVIAAVGITKDEDPDQRKFCVKLAPKHTKFDEERGIIRVAAVGTGFMLIKRNVVEKLWTAHKHNASPPPPESPHVGPISRIFEFDYSADDWGEDYTFCRRWQALGGEVWVDPGIRLLHCGNYAYTGTYLDWLKERSAQGNAA